MVGLKKLNEGMSEIDATMRYVTITKNLRQISSVADQYFIESRQESVSLAELLDKYSVQWLHCLAIRPCRSMMTALASACERFFVLENTVACQIARLAPRS
jgi:hypothetical protein